MSIQNKKANIIPPYFFGIVNLHQITNKNLIGEAKIKEEMKFSSFSFNFIKSLLKSLMKMIYTVGNIKLKRIYILYNA